MYTQLEEIDHLSKYILQKYDPVKTVVHQEKASTSSPVLSHGGTFTSETRNY